MHVIETIDDFRISETQFPFDIMTNLIQNTQQVSKENK